MTLEIESDKFINLLKQSAGDQKNSPDKNYELLANQFHPSEIRMETDIPEYKQHKF